jgi:hypothetical protein
MKKHGTKVHGLTFVWPKASTSEDATAHCPHCGDEVRAAYLECHQRTARCQGAQQRAHALAAAAADPEPSCITLYGQPVEEVSEFVYLGRLVEAGGHDIKEIRRRIAKARVAWHRLRFKYFRNGTSLKAKLAIYRTVVSSVLLYASETWKLNSGMADELRSFQAQCLRTILNRQPIDIEGTPKMPPTADLLADAKLEDIVDTWRSRRLLWTVKMLQQDSTSIHCKSIVQQSHRGWYATVRNDMERVHLDPLTDGLSVWRAHLKAGMALRQLV